LIGDQQLLTCHAYVCSVLASRTTPQEDLLRACQLVCELSSRCSQQQLLAFKRAGGTSAITSLLKSSDEEVLDAAASALASLSGECGARRLEEEASDAHARGLAAAQPHSGTVACEPSALVPQAAGARARLQRQAGARAGACLLRERHCA